MFTTFAGGWPSLVLWMFHCSWHSSVVLGEACALDVNTFLLLQNALFCYYARASYKTSDDYGLLLKNMSGVVRQARRDTHDYATTRQQIYRSGNVSVILPICDCMHEHHFAILRLHALTTLTPHRL